MAEGAAKQAGCAVKEAAARVGGAAGKLRPTLHTSLCVCGSQVAPEVGPCLMPFLFCNAQPKLLASGCSLRSEESAQYVYQCQIAQMASTSIYVLELNQQFCQGNDHRRFTHLLHMQISGNSEEGIGRASADTCQFRASADTCQFVASPFYKLPSTK